MEIKKLILISQQVVHDCTPLANLNSLHQHFLALETLKTEDLGFKDKVSLLEKYLSSSIEIVNVLSGRFDYIQSAYQLIRKGISMEPEFVLWLKYLELKRYTLEHYLKDMNTLLTLEGMDTQGLFSYIEAILPTVLKQITSQFELKG